MYFNLLYYCLDLDYSEDEIKKGNKKKRGKKFAGKLTVWSYPRDYDLFNIYLVESDEEKPPKKRGRPPKSASKPKELKSKKLFSDSDSDDEPPRKIKKLDKKDKHAKKCRDSGMTLFKKNSHQIQLQAKSNILISDESDGDNRSRFSGDGLYFDWSPQDTDPKAVTRFDQHLGYGNRLILCNYKKRNQLHFRKYTPEGKPTTQGITLPLAKLHIVKRALEAAETNAKAEEEKWLG